MKAAELEAIVEELGTLVSEIEEADALVGVPSAPVRVDTCRRRAIVLIDRVLAEVD